MKKKLLSGLVILGAASMLCGFDSAETLDSLSAKMNEASADIKGATAEATFNLDAAVAISDGTTNASLGVNANGGLNYLFSMDPFAMKADVDLTFSALGSGEQIKEEIYAVTDENGAMKMYMNVTDPGTGVDQWIVQTIEDLNINELIATAGTQTMSFSEMADWGITFALAPEAADVNGTECYLISATIDSASFQTLLQKSEEMTGQDILSDPNVSMVLSLLDGLKINVEYYVDAATYMPIKAHIDMNDSDFSMISQMLNGILGATASDDAPASTIDLTVNDVSMDLSMNYGEAQTITVPQEALDAEASGTATSAEDLAAAIG